MVYNRLIVTRDGVRQSPTLQFGSYRNGGGMPRQLSLRAVALLLVAAVAPAWAQSAGGATVQGTVTDSTGSVIPGAKVTITHLDTGVKTSSVTNKDGFFTIPPVQIGKYAVRCEHSGMKAWEEQVLLETGKT